MKKEYYLPRAIYFFRVEWNLLNGTICCSDNKKDAIKWIKKNSIVKCPQSKHTGVDSMKAYESIVGKNKLPVPNEIVEMELRFKVKRYKMKG